MTTLAAPPPSRPAGRGLAQPVIAGVVASIVGFASTFALVLAGLRAAGATPAQAASGTARAVRPFPGMAVLTSFGYRPRLRAPLVVTGGATVLGAPLGAHAINLAAITAALLAGPEAGPDPGRRWIAAAAGGATYVLFGLGAGLATVLVATAPPLLVEAVAGLALLGALAGALGAALADPDRREAAVITFAVAASGITVAGISSPFWGLAAGLAYAGLMRRR